MLKEILYELKWIIASKEMRELERWKAKQTLYRQWMSEFPDIALVLDNLLTDVEGNVNMNVGFPPDPNGPWAISNLREILRNRQADKKP